MAYHHKANKKDLENLLGHGRAKRGMFEGDLEEGELEIGQVSASIHDIIPADEIIQEMIADYRKALKNMPIL